MNLWFARITHEEEQPYNLNRVWKTSNWGSGKNSQRPLLSSLQISSTWTQPNETNRESIIFKILLLHPQTCLCGPIWGLHNSPRLHTRGFTSEQMLGAVTCAHICANAVDTDWDRGYGKRCKRTHLSNISSCTSGISCDIAQRWLAIVRSGSQGVKRQRSYMFATFSNKKSEKICDEENSIWSLPVAG